MRYIEYRLHVKHDALNDDVKRAAEIFHDMISDIASDPLASDVLTQDVTYEIRGNDANQLELNFEKDVK
jgi:hypothetical protein